MTVADRLDPELRRAVEALRDRAEDRLISGAAPAMTQVEGGEPMICHEWEASSAPEHVRP